MLIDNEDEMPSELEAEEAKIQDQIEVDDTKIPEKYRNKNLENPDRYQELLEEERLRDEAEGKTWLDIYARTSGSVSANGHSTPTPTQDRPEQAHSDEQGEGYDGAEA